MRRVLVIHHDEALRQTLQLALRGAGFEALGAATPAAALRELDAGQYALVLANLASDQAAEDGLLGEILRRRPNARVIALIAPPPGATGVEAGLRSMSAGAHDYLLAPFDSQDAVSLVQRAAARNGVEVARPAGSASRMEPAASEQSARPRTMIGNSPKLLALLSAIRRMAEFKTTVLVRGESGTGKELVARALHLMSPRATGPFVAVNCGAIPAGLMESELFGHRRGAFTDAVRDRQGLVEEANGGTLFLDEIAELPLALQVKLLRVLQEDQIRRLGDVEDVKVDVRIVAATARDLEQEMRAGQFREDLFYRLCVFSLHLPSLRERREDIPVLVEHFIRRINDRLGLGIQGITPDALQLLTRYGWPGNVRELENTIERAAVLCEGKEIDRQSLPERISIPAGEAPPPPEDGVSDRGHNGAGDGDFSIKRAYRRAEEDLIRRALAETGGNRTRAAELLEISHRALLYKIKEYGIGPARS
jgi:two-component system response regulator AtoC